MGQTAFTLIELLVVIAIIAILAAILFPVFAKSREKARQITCISNLKQFGSALISYSQDYDETLPPRYTNPAGGQLSWRGELMPYLKSFNVFSCPSNPRNADKAAYETNPQLQFPASYQIASFGGTNTSNGGAFHDCNAVYGCTGPYGVPLASIQTPASLIAIVDSTALYSDYAVAWPQNNYPGTPGSSDSRGSLFCHTNMSNLLFCDGHVKAMKPLATMSTSECGTVSGASVCGGGSMNLWTADNSNLPTADTINGYSPNNDRQNALGNLLYSQNKWQ
jgi:prepilin-type N-terminal cleavage/methylation domain-containing protein/prepilin-type processing-associated H-X9-DG protein